MSSLGVDAKTVDLGGGTVINLPRAPGAPFRVEAKVNNQQRGGALVVPPNCVVDRIVLATLNGEALETAGENILYTADNPANVDRGWIVVNTKTGAWRYNPRRTDWHKEMLLVLIYNAYDLSPLKRAIEDYHQRPPG